jgi:hypothetical protein
MGYKVRIASDDPAASLSSAEPGGNGTFIIDIDRLEQAQAHGFRLIGLVEDDAPKPVEPTPAASKPRRAKVERVVPKKE